MEKKIYEQPTMTMVKIQHQAHILSGSVDQYGMNKNVQEEEVDAAWVRRQGNSGVWDDDWSE